MTITKFVLPRLRRFKEVEAGYPGGLTESKWDAMLDKMIYAFETFEDHWDKELTPKEWRKIHEGFRLFGKWFMDLWW